MSEVALPPVPQRRFNPKRLVTMFAIVLMIWAFGWTGGKMLVKDSYSEAKVKAAEQSEARKERKAAKKAAGSEADG